VADEIEFTRIDKPLVQHAVRVMQLARERKLSMVTAESCTGGLIAAVLSEAPGAGDWLHGGFVTYTEQQKAAALGVDPGLIKRAGVVSESVARSMAEGALAHAPADVSIAVTGAVGPAPADDGTPVGTVHFAAARRGFPTLHVARDFGDIGRGRCRYGAVKEALALLERAASA
jgi:nicotinamide-nucleotide amidase